MHLTKTFLVGCLAGIVVMNCQAESTPANTATAKPASWWNPFGGKKDGSADVEVKDKDSIQKSVTGEQHRKVLAREEKAFFRRLEASDRLMEIAIKKNDQAMQSQIISLQERIQQVYSRKTANLPLPSQYPVQPSLENSIELNAEARKLLESDGNETDPIPTKSGKKGGTQP